MKADLAALPGQLDHVESLIDAGTIGGEEPNAADFQIAVSLRLLMCFDDLRPLIEGRPAGELRAADRAGVPRPRARRASARLAARLEGVAAQRA